MPSKREYKSATKIENNVLQNGSVLRHYLEGERATKGVDTVLEDRSSAEAFIERFGRLKRIFMN